MAAAKKASTKQSGNSRAQARRKKQAEEALKAPKAPQAGPTKAAVEEQSKKAAETAPKGTATHTADGKPKSLFSWQSQAYKDAAALRTEAKGVCDHVVVVEGLVAVKANVVQNIKATYIGQIDGPDGAAHQHNIAAALGVKPEELVEALNGKTLFSFRSRANGWLYTPNVQQD